MREVEKLRRKKKKARWLGGWVRLDHCWAAGEGSGAHLGEGAVVTTTVETDFGEPVAMCC